MQTEQGQSCCERLLEKEKLGSGELINKAMEKKIKVGGQFSGVGAFDQALKRLNIPHENVYQAEWDKYARQTYLHNYQEPFIYTKDVNDTPIDLINEKYGSLDLVMFSPPCQAFSLAGKRLGKADKRGILFFNSHEFIQENKPRFFIFENVKGLLSDSEGKTFSEWINMLGGKSVNGNAVLFPYEDSVPYHIYWKILNAKDFNIPQNRERVFIIGIRDDQDNRFTWPMEIPLQKRLKDVLENEVDSKYLLSDKLMSWIDKHRKKRDSSNKYPLDENDIGYCMTARYGKNGAEDPYIQVKSATKQGYETEQRLEINTNGTSNILTSVQKDNVILHNCITEAIGRQGSSKEYIDSCKKVFESTHQIRRLTPREAFRLMDFPDSFTCPVSDSQAYKQAGNSICVGVLAAIISKLKL